MSAIAVRKATSANEWDDYVRSHPDSTGDHLWHWQHVFSDVFGHQSVYLTATCDATVCGVLPLVCFRSRLFGRSVVSLPFLNYGGLLTSDKEAEAALLRQATDIARDFGAPYIELRHRRRICPELPVRQHKLGFVLPLPATAGELWGALDKKVRNQIRKAQKEGLTVHAGGAELVDEFYDVFATNMRDLGTPVYTKRLFTEVVRLFPAEAEIVVVRSGGAAIAGGVTFSYRGEMLVPWASALREYRHLCGNMLLYWTMLELATSRGDRTFDFGRSSPDSGPHQFKRQWGPGEMPLAWEYVLLRGSLPQAGSKVMDVAANVWQRLPLAVATRIGPAIVRNIP